MKNKFPIPRIDELMDELHGSNLFLDIDLRFGYHQIQMREEDIQNTNFICHYGHFEFFSMLFGLKNDPPTFKSCVNNIFHKKLHKLVDFFDDTLIYNKTRKEQLHHLEVLLKV